MNWSQSTESPKSLSIGEWNQYSTSMTTLQFATSWNRERSDGEGPYNPRFPGQYYMAETGLNQTLNRD
jgi:hypothetical protein